MQENYTLIKEGQKNTDIFLQLVEDKSSNIIGYASITYKGIRLNKIIVRKNTNGTICLDFPKIEDPNTTEALKFQSMAIASPDNYYVFPVSKAVRHEMTQMVLVEYQRQTAKLHGEMVKAFSSPGYREKQKKRENYYKQKEWRQNNKKKYKK